MVGLSLGMLFIGWQQLLLETPNIMRRSLNIIYMNDLFIVLWSIHTVCSPAVRSADLKVIFGMYGILHEIIALIWCSVSHGFTCHKM